MFSKIFRTSTLSCLASLGIVAGLLTVSAPAAMAQNDAEALAVPTVRITQPINSDQLVTLKGNVSPRVKAAADQGAVSASMQTGRIMLVLKPSAGQDMALKQYLGDLQNPNSANYHKWLTPAQYGQRYGISDTDLNTVTGWLQSQGFTVEQVPQGRNVIIFSGNVSQIQQAFHTSIHKYLVNGESHIANSSDPQIPAALAPVVAGVASLNDFHPRSHAIKGPSAHMDPQTRTIKPDFTLFDNNNNPFLYMVPADAATVYDTPNKQLNANFSSSTSYDGTGVTIGIVGDGNINSADITNYRTGFLGSLNTANLPNVIVTGNDPGITGDSIEAMLDTEVAGGIAPAAAINFYVGADTDLQSGLFLAIYRAVDDNKVDILNVSFGGCEAFQGTSGNNQIYAIWEQAAAQGISVTVSTGDSGSAGCDDPNSETSAVNGLQISGLSATPFNIAVGGTDFDILGTSLANFEKYVTTANSGASPYYRTALSYIPENPWNDSTTNNTAISNNVATKDSNGNTNIVGGGGGVSSCVSSTEDNAGNITCNGGWALPAFQQGVVQSQVNGGTNNTRNVPDVSFFASDGFYGATWLVCLDSEIAPNSNNTPYTDCQQSGGTFDSNSTFSPVGGTSAAAPAFAGMLALVAQSQGGRLGQADYVLYNLAKNAPTVFHDVTVGNNSVVCTAQSIDCTNGFLTGYQTGAGYDNATGLGSVDVSQLVTNWAKATFTPTTTSFTINGGTAPVSVTHGTTLTFAANVNPTSATGPVAIVNTSGVASSGSIGTLTLTNGAASGTSNSLPGGTYTVAANYGGDATDAASTSNSIHVTIAQEPSALGFQVVYYDAINDPGFAHGTAVASPTASATKIPYGAPISASAQPYGAAEGNKSAVATGTVTFDDNSAALPNQPTQIASNGIASYNNFYNSAASFALGTHSITAAYGGDTSYSASSASALGFTVIQGTTATLVAGSESSSGTVTLQAQINTDSIGAPPTGTVTFQVGTTTLGTATAAAQTGFVANGSNGGSTIASLYSVAIPATTTGLINGANTITATYSGDTNYSGSNGSASVTITGGNPGQTASFTLASSSALTISPGATSGNTTNVSVTPANGFSGSVALTCAITSTPTGATETPTCSLSPASVSIASGSTAAVQSTLTVSTTAPTQGALDYPGMGPGKGILTAVGGSVLACVVMLSIPSRRKSWKAILSIIAFAIAISAAIGCGGSSSNNGGTVGGTTPGAYTVTVTGTSGSTSAKTAVSVTVN